MSPAAALPAVQAFQRRVEATAARWPLPAWTACATAIIGLAAFAYIPLLGGGLIITGDTSHAMRIYELHRCLDDGQLPCRWVPDLGNGYGYPLFNYYPPLPYYAGNVLHGIGLSYVRAADLLFAFGLTGAGLTMFALARRLWGDLGGLVSAIAYVYAPYLALDVFLRGALPELWALAIAPAVFWALYELVTTGRARFVLLAALSGALLLLSHNLVAVIVAPAVVFWTAALLALRGRDWRRPALLASLAGVWAFGLAAFFTLPVLTEGGQVQLDSLTRGSFHYSDHFASVSDLFLSRSADYSFLLGGREETPLQIGWFHWGLAALALPVAFLLLRAGRRREVATVVLLTLFLAIGVFMATSASRPIWDAFHPLRFLQFPWRYLGLVSLAAAGLAGASLALLRGRPAIAQLGVAIVLVGLFIGSGHVFFQPLYRCNVSDAEVIAGSRAANAIANPICDSIIQHPEGAAIHDYLPKAVAAIPDPPAAPARVVDGSARIEAAASGSDWLRLRFEAVTPARIETALFDYPNWRVRIDGKKIPHETSSPYGLITFAVPPGTHEVSLRLEDTLPRRAGNALSLVSWSAVGIALAVLLLLPRLRSLGGAA
jgi:hypothetical protein